jgi:mRNA interferase MazF
MMPRRGDIWWVALDPVAGSEIAKTRPAVVLTNDIVNQRRRTVVVVPLSSAPSASPPMLVAIRCAGRDAVAVIDQIRAVSKQRLRDRVGEVSAPELAALEEALREVLDLG